MHFPKTLKLVPLLLFILASFFTACENGPQKPAPTGFSDNEFISKLKAHIRPFDTLNKKVFRSLADDVRFTYQSDDYQPIWVKENYKPVDGAAKLLDELEDTYWDGLDTVRYHLADLRKLKLKLDTVKVNSVIDAITLDTGLTRCYLMAAKDLLIGRVVPKKAD